jgi:hypothetical protein
LTAHPIDVSWQRYRRGSWKAVLLLLTFIASFFSPRVESEGLDDGFYHELFYRKAPPPHFPPPTDQTDAQRQDAEYFRNYFDLDKAFTPQARAEAEQRYQALLLNAGKLSPARFELGLASLVALARNGHSQLLDIGRQLDGQRYKQFPFFVGLYAEGPCITYAMQEAASLLGSCVTAVDGVPIDRVLDTLRKFFGGGNAHFGFTPMFIGFLLHPAFLFAAGICRNDSSAVIAYRSRDGEVKTLEVEAVPAAAAENKQHWQGLFNAVDPVPIYLRHPDAMFVRLPLADVDGFYIQLKVNKDYFSHSIRGFLDAALLEIEKAKPRFVVVDFRGNTGGDFTKTTSAMSRLPRLLGPGGRTYVITDGGTFSAAITNINVLKQAGDGNTIIVGEQVGDSQRFWSEGGKLCLPNSKACFAYARGLHDYAHGCEGELACYESFVPAGKVPLRVASLKPDIPLTFTFSDYRAGRDAALDAILSEELKLRDVSDELVPGR